MSEDKKKKNLFGKILGKKDTDEVSATAEEQASFDALMEQKTEDADSNNSSEYADWLSEAALESEQDPDEDISEALAELFGENASETADGSASLNISGFDELAAAGESEYGIYNTEETEEEYTVEEASELDGAQEYEEYSTDAYETPDTDAEVVSYAEDASYSEENESVVTANENSDGEKGKESSVDEDTATLLAALGYSDAKSSSRIKTSEKDSSINRTSDLSLAFGYDGKEYTSRSQTASVKSCYASDKVRTVVRLGATALFALLLCVYDIFGNKFGGALDPAAYPVVNIMVSLQLLLIASAFSVNRLFVGLKGIFKGNLNVYSIGVASVIIAVIYDVILSIAAPETFTLYNFPASIALVLCCVHDYLVLQREMCVFDRISSWNSVATLEKVDSHSLAAELGETGDTVGHAFRMRKGDFAENYFRHINRRHPMSKMLAFFVTPAVALAFVLFFVTLAFNRTFVEASSAFVGVSMFILPTFIFVSISFPFLTLTTKNLDDNSVVLNETDVNEYRAVDTVVFDEAELFDETSLTINRISVCDKNQMQDVFDIMCCVSAMYNMIGGRIAGAFRASTADGEIPSDVSVLKVEDGGFEGTAAGRHYCVGSEIYLSSKNISVMRYYDDKYIASNPGGVVLHIAVDGVEVFKLYLTYSISNTMLSVINDLSASQTRIVLRTIDPNINMDLISRILTNSFDGNLTLVRKPYDGRPAEEHQKNEGVIDGGILVNGESSEAILKTIVACRLFGAFSKFNFLAGAVVAGIGALFALFLGVIGAIVNLPSIYIFIFQLASVFPCIIFANIFLNINKD